MTYVHTRSAADVLSTLKAYRDDLHDKMLRKSHWPLLDRLILRETEMAPVWEEMARHALTPEQCWSLLEQVFVAGAYGTGEYHGRLKADRSKLTVLNADIASRAAELAGMLAEREAILNRNSIHLEHTSDIVDLINAASGENGHFQSFLCEPLEELRCRYDCKYWPTLQQILNVVAGEAPEAVYTDPGDKAIVHARGAAVPDFLRRLFSGLHKIRIMDGDWRRAHIYLPAKFRLTDASLATLATVSLDLDEPATTDQIKQSRTRLKKDGYPGVWATPAGRTG